MSPAEVTESSAEVIQRYGSAGVALYADLLGRPAEFLIRVVEVISRRGQAYYDSVWLTFDLGPRYGELLEKQSTKVIPVPILTLGSRGLVDDFEVRDATGALLPVLGSDAVTALQRTLVNVLDGLKVRGQGARPVDEIESLVVVAERTLAEMPVIAVEVPIPATRYLVITYERTRLHNRQDSLRVRSAIPSPKDAVMTYLVPIRWADLCRSYHLHIAEEPDRYLSSFDVASVREQVMKHCVSRDGNGWKVCIRNNPISAQMCRKAGTCLCEILGRPTYSAKVAARGSPYAHLFGQSERDREVNDPLWAVVNFHEVPPGRSLGIVVVGLAIVLVTVLVALRAETNDETAAVLLALLLFGLSMVGLSPDATRSATILDKIALGLITVAVFGSTAVVLGDQSKRTLILHLLSTRLSVRWLLMLGAVALVGTVLSGVCLLWNLFRYRKLVRS